MKSPFTRNMPSFADADAREESMKSIQVPFSLWGAEGHWRDCIQWLFASSLCSCCALDHCMVMGPTRNEDYCGVLQRFVFGYLAGLAGGLAGWSSSFAVHSDKPETIGEPRQ
ncbi:unnamed protein product [Ostreobium quekettii]|uniref:Uncharacterized protein n=1 Tax=Ostreobium quekettii TaxID=121088 RepID=A0A8S1ILM9_9CHLO|nr:unnamed protein product [Ostreobium quekettii]|eukprot:evm.model.scf_1186.4 EVM.evm.TU.scf_1186.4   scf_1186:28996-29331(+)